MSTTCNETSVRGRNLGLFGRAAERLLRPLAPAARAIASGCTRINDTLFLWIDRDRQRRALQELSEHMLKDIGMSTCDVHREAMKKFWHE